MIYFFDDFTFDELQFLTKYFFWRNTLLTKYSFDEMLFIPYYFFNTIIMVQKTAFKIKLLTITKNINICHLLVIVLWKCIQNCSKTDVYFLEYNEWQYKPDVRYHNGFKTISQIFKNKIWRVLTDVHFGLFVSKCTFQRRYKGHSCLTARKTAKELKALAHSFHEYLVYQKHFWRPSEKFYDNVWTEASSGCYRVISYFLTFFRR